MVRLYIVTAVVDVRIKAEMAMLYAYTFYLKFRWVILDIQEMQLDRRKNIRSYNIGGRTR